jgi:hypothetical protein
MEYTEYDRDSEAIEPLVPHFAESTEQPSDSSNEISSGNAQRPDHTQSSHLEQTSYYTWDVEMIAPLVPVLAGPHTGDERR